MCIVEHTMNTPYTVTVSRYDLLVQLLDTVHESQAGVNKYCRKIWSMGLI